MIINPNTPLANKSVTTDKISDGSVTWPKLATDARPINDNLLGNAYFIGGGSQQGGGQFPINQQGLTEYPNNGYFIDRWSSYSMIKELSDIGIILTQKGSTSGNINQRLEMDEYLHGKKVTYSALVDIQNNANGVGLTGILPNGQNYYVFERLNGVTGLQLLIATFIVPNDMSGVGIYAWSQSNGSEHTKMTVKAAKLELSDHQTLAFQDEDGNWVLNDPPPNYALELAKCQRYQLPIIQWQKYPVVGMNANAIDICISTPVTLRTTPTITSNFSVLDKNTGITHYGFVPACSYPSPGFIFVSINKENHGVTIDMGNIEVFCSNTYGMIDANL